METPSQNIESLFANAGEYLETKAELWKLKMVDKTSSAVSSIVEKVILFFLGLMFFILLKKCRIPFMGLIVFALFKKLVPD